jgi:hypothetical protein
MRLQMTSARHPVRAPRQHHADVHVSDCFLGSDLHDDLDAPRSLHEALDSIDHFTPELARAGWCCRFYSRLSTADRLYLTATLDVPVRFDDEDDPLLAVCGEFHLGLSLFLFRTDVDGLCEFLLMPWEGAELHPAALLTAAHDVLSNLVGVVAWDPHGDLRRFADDV